MSTNTPASPIHSPPAPQGFDALADLALVAMGKRAVELNIKGVALVAYAPGEAVATWSSKMLVVDMMIRPASAEKSAANLLAIAYSKAAEMADTLKHSGSAGRAPFSGELGYGGGRMARGKAGILLAAFSGGPAEDDAKVSQAGLDVFAGRL